MRYPTSLRRLYCLLRLACTWFECHLPAHDYRIYVKVEEYKVTRDLVGR